MLLALNNISFSFGARPILDEASWQINPGQRIGLVGPNGAGKSTLLRLIMSEYIPDSGEINKAKDTTIGFFNQDLLSFSTDDSILKVAMGAYERAHQLEKEMTNILTQLETDPDNESLLLKYSEVLHDFEMAGGYDMEHKAAEILEGLGFTTQQLQKSYNKFSGGWRMRVLLAKMMLQQPDILMLDEPTNHLDLPSIEWLERYLSSYPGTVIIVSHDRYFLDRMVTTIVELFMQKLHIYSGNYTFYETEKATRLAFLEREYENQQKFIKQQERFIERFKAKASKATQAQSVIKRLEKLDRIELPDADIPKMNINFEVGLQPGKIIVDMKDVCMSYGDVDILKNAQFEINRGDKIALIGANGKGKSTLLRILADQEKYTGKRSGGHNVQLSFYAQHQLESLDVELPILDELKAAGTGKTEVELRQLLGCFLFTGDDVFKKIKVLSGGEKARVALAKVIASKSNFLLLDEPTNHLDMMSVELLIEALQKYEGTYVIVSHDRYFISQTATQFWQIMDGKVEVFKGTYEEWERYNEEKKAQQLVAQQMSNAKKNNTPVIADKPKVKNKGNDNQITKLKNTIQSKEKNLNELKSHLATVEHQLAQPELYQDPVKFKKTEEEYNALTEKVAQLSQEVDQLIEELILLED